jgi:O-antigen/teichoic acid export membrane protein
VERELIDQARSSGDGAAVATAPLEVKLAPSVLWKNTFAIGLSRIGSIALDGCTYILTARYFGPSLYGQYLSIAAFLNLVDIASDMAIIDVTVREMSKEPERTGTWLSACTILRMLLGLAGVAAFAVYVSLAHYSGELLKTAWVAALILPAGALRTPLTVFRATLKMHYELGVVIATRALNLGLFVWLVTHQGTMRQFFLATSVSRILLAILCWAAVRSLVRIRIVHLAATLKRLFYESIPMALSGGFVAVQLKADILLLSRLSSAAAAGLYGAVAQLPEYSLYVPVIISTPALPMLSRAFAAGSKDRFQELYGGMCSAILSLVIPAAIMAIIMPSACVIFVFGAQYASVSKVLPLLALSIVAMWISHATAIAALAIGLQAHFVRIQLICVSSYLVLDLLFIRRFDVMAAASVRLVANIIAPMLTYFLVKRAGFGLDTRKMSSTVAAGLAMAAVVWLCSTMPIMAAGSIGLAAYGLVLALASKGSMNSMSRGMVH